ncbi:MAG: tetratricopeptide repeat protein [Promethearchaeota archaeon]
MMHAEITFKELLKHGNKLTFLVGAGCSTDPPSCLPLGREMIEAIVKHSCAESEIEKLLEIEDLRFEQLVEIIRDKLDPDLKVIDYYSECDKPNLQHFFLAKMIKEGHFVITTNFDFLIERALLESGVPKGDIVPVISRRDYENPEYQDPVALFKKGKKAVYKVHGSIKNLITGEDTRDSLVATIQAFGSGKEGESVFQLENFKRPAIEALSDGRSLVIIGYSGSDDFDVVPTLKVLKNIKNVFWIDHVQNYTREEMVFEFDDWDPRNKDTSDRIARILTEIMQARNATNIYRVKANTTTLIQRTMEQLPKLSTDQFDMPPKAWLEKKIDVTYKHVRFYIPFLIFKEFNLYDEAMECCQRILEIARQERNNELMSEILGEIGFLFYEKDELDEAITKFQESLALIETFDILKGKAPILNNIGLVLNQRGKYHEAIEYYQKALEIAEKLGTQSERADYLNNIAYILEWQGTYDEALKIYQRALSIDEQLGNLRGRATRLNNIGHVLKLQGKVKEALQMQEQALAIAEQLGDSREKVIYLNNVAISLNDKGNDLQALNYLREALDISERFNYPCGKVITLNSKGTIIMGFKQLENALKEHKEALALSEQLNYLEGKGVSLSNIGRVLKLQGKLDKALENFRNALAIYDKMSHLRGKAVILSNIGTILLEKEDLNGALRHFQEALAINEKLGISMGINANKGWIEKIKRKRNAVCSK